MSDDNAGAQKSEPHETAESTGRRDDDQVTNTDAPGASSDRPRDTADENAGASTGPASRTDASAADSHNGDDEQSLLPDGGEIVDAASASGIDPRTTTETLVYELTREIVDDEFRAVYTHSSTGLRVLCRQPVDLFYTEILPPASMGDTAMFRIGVDQTPDAARARAENWMNAHPTGVPETAPTQITIARVSGELPSGDEA